MNLAFNKVCEIEDFETLSDLIYEIFPDDRDEIKRRDELGGWNRKHWEIAMSVRALRRFGALHDDALILGVGAGTEVTSFYLTNHVKLVFATDLYLDAGEWSSYAPSDMLTNPGKYAPGPFREDHLIVQHMNGCRLKYPDNTFDGIYSSSSIEHFGSLDAIQTAAAEMGRVLKPGGILTLATEYKVIGPARGNGWDINNTMIFSQDMIQEVIVSASGLQPVDEIDIHISDDTMKCTRDLMELLESGIPEHCPNVMIAYKGYIFCSIHLTLRKETP